MMGRNLNYTTPREVAPFIDRCIWLKVLPEPKKYSVVWEDLNSLTPEEKATIAAKQTEAMAKYIQGSVESIIAPVDFLSGIMGIPEDQATAWVKEAEELLPEEPEESVEREVKEPFGEEESIE